MGKGMGAEELGQVNFGQGNEMRKSPCPRFACLKSLCPPLPKACENRGL